MLANRSLLVSIATFASGISYSAHLLTQQLVCASDPYGDDTACTPSVMDDAAEHSHLEIVKFLLEHRQEGCTTAAMDKTAAAVNLEVVKFLHKNREEGCTTGAVDEAGVHGHLEVVQLLLKTDTRAAL